MEKTFAIGIPTLNRFDLLLPTLLFYKIEFPDIKIFVLDNGKQGIGRAKEFLSENTVIVENEKNVGVAASWNQLCDLIFEEHDNALLLNDDVYLGKKTFHIKSLLENYDSKALYVGEYQWSVFILPKETFEKVGRFDEKIFPGYLEDNDYMYRMKLLWMTPFVIPFLNPARYQNSSTVEKAPELMELQADNRRYYERKWGGLPGEERFKVPFDNKN